MCVAVCTFADRAVFASPVAPTIRSYPSPTSVYTKGIEIRANTPGLAGGDVVSWSITPALPTGLEFSTSTGVVSGTPSALSVNAVEYTVTATNSGGDSTYEVTITVIDGRASPMSCTLTSLLPCFAACLTCFLYAVEPSSLAYSAGTSVYTKGTAITDNSPTSAGGDVVSYAISPALPAGLELDTTTGVISGNPSVLSTTATAYTVTATNSGGSTTARVTITVNDGRCHIILLDTIAVVVFCFCHCCSSWRFPPAC